MATVDAFEDATLLIGLGPQRTGSRWISTYLNEHPDTLMSPIRVLHFFDRSPKWNGYYVDRLAEAEARFAAAKGSNPSRSSAGLEMLRERVRMNGDESAYLDFYRKRWAGEPVFCDVTPAYYALNRADYERMRDCHARVKFLLVLRNPIDRFWSEIRMKRAYDQGFDIVGRLDRILEHQRTIWKPGYIEAIEKLDAVVPPNDTKILFFEGMFTSAVIDDFCGFLGVPPSPAGLGPPINESEPHPLDGERRARMYKRLEHEYRFVLDRFEGRLPLSWLNDIERFG